MARRKRDLNSYLVELFKRKINSMPLDEYFFRGNYYKDHHLEIILSRRFRITKKEARKILDFFIRRRD